MLQFRQGDERLVLAHLTRWWRQRRKPNPRIKAEAIMLEITPAAQDYIAEKLAKEPVVHRSASVSNTQGHSAPKSTSPSAPKAKKSLQIPP